MAYEDNLTPEDCKERMHRQLDERGIDPLGFDGLAQDAEEAHLRRTYFMALNRAEKGGDVADAYAEFEKAIKNHDKRLEPAGNGLVDRLDTLLNGS